MSTISSPPSATTNINIPLTTVFTPDPTCSTDYLLFPQSSTPTLRLAWAYTFLITESPQSTSTNTACEPSSIEAVLKRERQSAFSPGICASGFTTATSSFISGTMHAYCCLSGYGIPDSLDKRYFQESAALDLVQCVRYMSTTVRNIGVIGTQTRLSGRLLYVASTTSLSPPVIVQHDAHSVAWQPRDLTAFAEATPTLNTLVLEESLAADSLGLGAPKGTTSGGRASISTSGSTSAPTSDATNVESGSGGMSNGAKIGIGLGVGIVAALLLGVGVYFYFRRRRQNELAKSSEAIERDGVNQMGGIEESPVGMGGIPDEKYR
ncbi:hypothetical protein H072_470 [Dactylellina haptotyla CBS 200.50]|uniref:Mid2 domain-containing protein n=1 Tax=Dactylellina haptotyla (strain CBS 200.50) TaxID=1284197 RepID=S8ARR5_DACHA|nr:hypothetical protein H072_470 [Dactylellina haptotyla CBS 200.50]